MYVQPKGTYPEFTCCILSYFAFCNREATSPAKELWLLPGLLEHPFSERFECIQGHFNRHRMHIACNVVDFFRL